MQGIPESSGYFALSLALLGVPLRWKRIIAMGTILALVFFVVRALPFTFGLHMAVGIFLVVIFISRSTHIAVTRIFVAVLVSFTTLVLLELIVMEIFFTATSLDPNTTIMENNNVLWKISGVPQGLLLNIFALLISRFKNQQEDACRI